MLLLLLLLLEILPEGQREILPEGQRGRGADARWYHFFAFLEGKCF
jgi:hypothetical protein